MCEEECASILEDAAMAQMGLQGMHNMSLLALE